MTRATVDGMGAGRGPDSETGGTATAGSDSETGGTATNGETDGATGGSDSETGETATSGETDGATTTCAAAECCASADGSDCGLRIADCGLRIADCKKTGRASSSEGNDISNR